MALDTDWTSAGFNSYVTLVESDAIVTQIALVREVSNYSALTDPDKESLLVQATDWIYDFLYQGTVGETNVPLAVFPRTGITDIQGNPVVEDDIPDDVKTAQVTRVIDMLDGLATTQSMAPSKRSDYTRSQRLSQALSRSFFQAVTGLAGRSVEYITTQTPAFLILKPYMDEDFLEEYASGRNKYLDRV